MKVDRFEISRDDFVDIPRHWGNMTYFGNDLDLETVHGWARSLMLNPRYIVYIGYDKDLDGFIITAQSDSSVREDEYGDIYRFTTYIIISDHDTHKITSHSKGTVDFSTGFYDDVMVDGVPEMSIWEFTHEGSNIIDLPLE